MTNQCCGLAFIFRVFILHLNTWSREKAFPEMFSGVHGFAGKTKTRLYTKKIQTVTRGIFHIIIQQIVTLSKYGHDALDICHP